MTALEDPKWLALSEERRDQLLEEHRNTNVEHVEWWDYVYEQFDEQMAEVGIYVNRETYGRQGLQRLRIYFSGFWSQGDGACFDGHVNDWPKFFTAAGRPELIDLYEKLTEPLFLSWRHNGHYYHSDCTIFTGSMWLENPHDEEDDPFQHEVWEQVYESGLLFDRLESDFIKYVRSLMDDLYTTLEEEYDYLTSDEAVVEYILDHCEEQLVEDPEEISCAH